MSVNLLDRFLAKKHVPRKRLQLVGLTAAFIAAKFEEAYPLEIIDLVYICDKAYTKNEIEQMEILVLTTLEFQLVVPTAVTFLDRFSELNSCNDRQRHLAQYLAELALPEIKMIRFAPSHLAAAAIFLSNNLLKQSAAWSGTMCNQTGYIEAAIKTCAKELCGLLEGGPQGGSRTDLQAVRKKFSLSKYHKVATISF